MWAVADSPLDLARLVHQQVEFHKCLRELLRTFDIVEVLEQYGCYMNIRVGPDAELGTALNIVERMDLDSYSVSQTTLD